MGAGSGSSYYYPSSGGSSYHNYAGNSGAYIAANISTVNNETFYFRIGKGGISPYYVSLPGVQCSINMYIGYNGENSVFNLPDNSLLLNVSGGIAYYFQSYNAVLATIPASVVTSYHRADDSIINKSEGYIVLPCCSSYCQPYTDGNYYGANAPYGSLGGYSKSATNNTNCSGTRGSGCGMYCNYKPSDPKVDYYKGGNGALIVYY